MGMYFFWRELLLVEAANGVTPAIQGLNICSGVITPRILGGVFNPRILGGGIYPQDFGGGFFPQDSRGGGVNNPNNPLMAATVLKLNVLKKISLILNIYFYQLMFLFNLGE